MDNYQEDSQSGYRNQGRQGAGQEGFERQGRYPGGDNEQRSYGQGGGQPGGYGNQGDNQNQSYGGGGYGGGEGRQEGGRNQGQSASYYDQSGNQYSYGEQARPERQQQFGGESYGNAGGAGAGGYGSNTGTSYGGGGAAGGYSDDFSGAQQHAQQHASGEDSGLFSQALSFLGQNKSSIAQGDVDEQGAVAAHQSAYGNAPPPAGGHSSGSLGSAAALQALKKFTGGQGSQGGGQNAFIGMAMAQASKLFDSQASQGNVQSGASKQDAVSSAAQTALKMYMKSEMGGGGSGGGLMSMASKFF